MTLSSSTHARRLGQILVTLALVAVFTHTLAAQTASPPSPTASTTIAGLDRPFLFAYGSWEKRAQIVGGIIRLEDSGLTPRGGGGTNLEQPLDLRSHAGDCPALQLKTGPHNTMKAIQLLLIVAAGHNGAWQFDLPTPGSDFTLVFPHDGAPLSRPNRTDNNSPAPDLGKIVQWQVSGDWSSDDPGGVDVQISGLLVAPPDAGAIAARQARIAQDAATEAQEQQQRDAQSAKYGKRTAQSPAIEAVYAAAPDILALQIQAGHVLPGHLEDPYQPQPGDQTRKNGDATVLVRGGQEVGWLIGLKHDALVTYEHFTGDPLLDNAGDITSYTIRSADDPAFAAGVAPIAVYRKSKPTDWVQPTREFAMRHLIYLKLPHPLTSGKTYHIHVSDAVNVRNGDITLLFDPAKIRSEAVHASQIGFRPDDPSKHAYLSLWLGTGGDYKFPAGQPFHLVDAATGRIVYQGKATMDWPVDRPETMFRTENFNKTGVTLLDFSRFQTPGHYRVFVDGVGCSYPFEIGRNVWTTAFITQMRGLLNQRSGVTLGPPYTQFRKPPDFRPDLGAPVYQSTYSFMDGSTDEHTQQVGLVAHSTGKIVPQAWGGYHDAGDWNPRRVTHMRVTMAQLELMELFPTYFGKLSWNLPQPSPVPPILREALFELDLFRRLQQPDGGVGYGIETNGDPLDGEVSWHQSMPAYVYAPDLWSSYIYAGVAGRMAKVLARYAPAEAKIYRDSALKAMRWAEADHAKRAADGTLDKLPWQGRDDRNLAALVLYDLTGDRHWNDIFLEDTCLKEPNAKVFVWGDHVQRDAAFLYTRLPKKLSDPVLRQRAVAGLVADAETALTYAQGNAWGLTASDPGQPMFLGFYSTANGGVVLARAHAVTGNPKYLAGAVQACLFPAGCNPNNMTYTVGLGENSVQHPLHLDSRRTGQPAPTGLTVYGNIDFVKWNDPGTIWPMTYYLGTACVPSAYSWPIPEAYFDISPYPMENEFVVDGWTPNVFVWGYLAARGQTGSKAMRTAALSHRLQ